MLELSKGIEEYYISNDRHIGNLIINYQELEELLILVYEQIKKEEG